MSLPQTACAAPPGEHASVNVCPSAPFSDEAFASQVVGVPLPAEDGGAGDEVVFELSPEAFVWPPPPVFSFLSLEQPALLIAIAVSKTQTPVIRRSSRNRDSRHCCSCVDWYDGFT